jgi:hypothetical protein
MAELTRGPRTPDASRLYFPVHPPGPNKIERLWRRILGKLSRTDIRYGNKNALCHEIYDNY